MPKFPPSRRRSTKRRWSHPAVLAGVAAAASLAVAHRSNADNYYFNHAGGGDWNSAGDPYFSWVDTTTHAASNLPAAGSFANLSLVGSGTGVANATVNYNYSYGTNSLTNLLIDSNNTLSQTSGTSTLNSAGVIEIGASSTGTYAQSNGNVSTATLYVGTFATGFYNFSGGGLSASATSYVGYDAVGTFNQTGGYYSASAMSVGTLAIGSGTYGMSNAASSLSLSGQLLVGDLGNGRFNLTGGTVSVGTNGAGLVLGNLAGSSGTVTVSGGTLSVGAYPYVNASGSNSIRVGYNGSGHCSQSGGVVNGAAFALGDSNGTATSPNTYQLSGGTLNAFNQQILSANSAAAAPVFTQSGGVNNVADLGLSGAGSAAPAYLLSGGTLNCGSSVAAAYYPGEFIGYGSNAPASFTQTGGTNSITYGGLLIGGYYYDTGSAVYTLSNGLLQVSNSNTYVGQNDGSFGVFNQSGGINVNGGTLYISYSWGSGYGSGTYNLSGGVLQAANLQVNPGGLFNQTGGTLDAAQFLLAGGTVTGTLQNLGTFTYQSGNFAGRLLNQGAVNLGTSFTAGNGIENDASITIPAGAAVYANGAGFDNVGTLYLRPGGTLAGTGPLINDYGGTLYGGGNLTGAFLNNGILYPSGVLTLSATMTNAGVVYLSPGQTIRSTGTGAVVSNAPGGTIQGAGALPSAANLGGLVYANGSTPLTITSLLANNNGGELRVADSATLTVVNPFTNAATVTLQGSNASLTGGTLSNAGAITGVGRVTNPIVNIGLIAPAGGKLTFTAAGALNAPAGQIQVTAGNTATFPQGLTNAGTVALNGGTLDTGSATLNNTGQVLGNGTLTTGGILNSGTVYLSDINSSIYGAFTNNGSLKITSNVSTFYGAVTNNGSVKTTAATARFLSAFVNNGTYVSDPSAQYFADITVGANGAFIGGAGDSFTLTGSLHSSSTRPDVWNTRSATLTFTGGGSSTTHDIDVGGAPNGTYADNYAWGTLGLDSGQTLVLHDADATPGGALYTSILQLDGAPDGAALTAFIATHVQSADAANPMTLYYDPTQPANAYLAAGTYPLGNGGDLTPATPAAVPEPVGLTCGTLAALLIPRRRRTRTGASLTRRSGPLALAPVLGGEG